MELSPKSGIKFASEDSTGSEVKFESPPKSGIKFANEDSTGSEVKFADKSPPKTGIKFASEDSTGSDVKFADEPPTSGGMKKSASEGSNNVEALPHVSHGWNTLKGAVLKSGLKQTSKYASNDEPPLAMPYIAGSMIGLSEHTSTLRKKRNDLSFEKKKSMGGLVHGQSMRKKKPENKKGFSNGRLLMKRQSVNRGYTFRLAKGQSYKAVQYIDLLTGKTFMTTTEKFLDPTRYRKVDGDDIEAPGGSSFDPLHPSVEKFKNSGKGVHDLQSYNEIDALGSIWRCVLRALINVTANDVNSLRFTRGLQIFLPFLSGYESFVLSEVIRAFENKNDGNLSKVLAIGFSCRNVSRIMVQQMQRYDIVWHQSTQFKWNRWFDSFGNLPLFGVTSFPATENFPDTRSYAIASVFRRVLGAGLWQTRVITGREALQTDDINVVAQNLAAEASGFELANRNQFGSYLGRLKTNAFRTAHRLPTDESIVRTFITTPLTTLINNGVEHVIKMLAKHFHNMLYQPYGNFAHQRMEQMNPFEFLRFHMPVILVALCALRGISSFDAEVLAPFVERLQLIQGIDNVNPMRDMIKDMNDSIVVPVCGGIASRVDALRALLDALDSSLGAIEEESSFLVAAVGMVDSAINIGMDLVANVNWQVPKDSVLLKSVHEHCLGQPVRHLAGHIVEKAVVLLAPKDRRTLIELIKNGFENTTPAMLLAKRVVTLLQREIRRAAIDAQLRVMAKGPEVKLVSQCTVGAPYILLTTEGYEGLFVYQGKKTGAALYRFVHKASNQEHWVKIDDGTVINKYIEVAEAITRAQHAYMVIELDHGKKFSYNAFMEFNQLRVPLRRLLVLSQIICEELDDARLNVLQSIKSSSRSELSVKDLEPGVTYYTLKNKVYVPFTPSKKFDPDGNDNDEFDEVRQSKIVIVPPQSMIVIGGGPTGLLTSMHCLENVLSTQGTMRLYESRDAFDKGGATFERSQIVRLDPRWIAMLRYHLGCIYEDEFIPASGETDPHYGNTLPSQGFIEITIKDMESMMNIQVSKLASRDLLRHDTNSGAQYDIDKNQLVKLGKALKVDDLVRRQYDTTGERCEEFHTWKVKELVFAKTISAEELVKAGLGVSYAVFIPSKKSVFPMRLIGMNILTGQFHFQALGPSGEDLMCDQQSLPAVYKAGTKVHGACDSVILESHLEDVEEGGYAQETLAFADIEKVPFLIDVGHCHVCEAIGKPHGSKVHFEITTEEPYGVCCMSGLKVSMGMHNFGTRRWASGIEDDFRSHTDQNTRVVGDFTKTVNSSLIVKNMHNFVKTDPNWRLHLEKVVQDLGFGEELRDIWALVLCQAEVLMKLAPFRRTHLQTRFFETGDNFYLGMEFPREYDKWKKNTVALLVALATNDKNTYSIAVITDKVHDAREKRKVRGLEGSLAHQMDRLWYDACLETIRMGDVYNPGGQSKVPRLYMFDGLTDIKLGTLAQGEAFVLEGDKSTRYEVLLPGLTNVTVRDHQGYLSTMSPGKMVRIGGNLTRNPGGVEESKVSIATFPVGHFVNHRTIRLNPNAEGYLFAFLGDEQSTPHFMRYSGLTGAAINCMLINNFIGDTLERVSFKSRCQQLSAETNWSNGEVVTRGTGANFGEDGFLFPGFTYAEGVRFLRSKVLEYTETEQDLNSVLSRDWKSKFAAALIPRGMEFNKEYLGALVERMQKHIFSDMTNAISMDPELLEPCNGMSVVEHLNIRAAEMAEMDTGDHEAYWTDFVKGMTVPPAVQDRLANKHIVVASRLEKIVLQVIEHAQKQFEKNERISSLATYQPNSTDSLIDDFAVEAQGFTTALTNVGAVSAAALALQFITPVGSAIVSAFSVWFAIGTITGASRYKYRNESWRETFFDDKYVHVLKSLYSALNKDSRAAIPNEKNPFIMLLEEKKNKFIADVSYYDHPKPEVFMAAYNDLVENCHDPAVIKRFMTELTTHLLPDTYQVNSYLQADLVSIFILAEEMHRVEINHVKNSSQLTIQTMAMFERLFQFRPRLETSLQRGEISIGAVKSGKFKHSHIMAILQFIWLKFCVASTNVQAWSFNLPRTVEESVKAGSSPYKPVAMETEELVAQMRALSHTLPSPNSALQREILDMESLYYATKESLVSSVIILPAILSFFTGIVFTVANIGDAVNPDDWNRVLLVGASYSFGLLSPLSAVLSVYYLLRKLRHLFYCKKALGKRQQVAADADAKSHLSHIRGVVLTQQVVTMFRVTASACAATALPWAWAIREGFVNGNQRLPLFVALAAVALQVISVVLRFLVEYTVLYHLDPQLGGYVCVAFDSELQNMKKDLTTVKSDSKTDYAHAREMWEYVARAFLHKYRFDTVFAANRFGSILQFIQSGLAERNMEDDLDLIIYDQLSDDEIEEEDKQCLEELDEDSE